MAHISVIIPTLGRGDSLKACKESIERQTYQDWELILVTEEGSLSALRNEGAKRAKGDILVFTDDDVVASVGWLASLHEVFTRGFSGASGPAVISKAFRLNRDCFRLGANIFSSRRCGQISPWGQWSLEACKEGCDYDGPVDYLEACNMAFKADAFWSVNGFDERYKGIGDWSEPDLCFRLRKKGYKLWFSRDARVEHRPSQTGAYKKRLVKCDRMENYELFSKRWVAPSLQHTAYKAMLRTYFWLKERGHV